MVTVAELDGGLLCCCEKADGVIIGNSNLESKHENVIGVKFMPTRRSTRKGKKNGVQVGYPVAYFTVDAFTGQLFSSGTLHLWVLGCNMHLHLAWLR